MSSKQISREKLKDLYDLYYNDDDKNFRYTYEKWLRDGVPTNKPSKMGKVMTFLHDNFGLNYGDNERFQEIEKEFTKYLQETQGYESDEDEKRKVPPLDLTKITDKHKKLKEPEKETQEQINLELTLNNLNSNEIFEKNEDGEYKYPKLIKKLIKKYKNKDENLSKTTKEFIENHIKEFSEALYEIHNKKYISEPLEKVLDYDKKLRELEYTIKFPKNELERKKALELKKNIEEKIKHIYVEDYYKKLTNGQKMHYVEPAKLNSYIPNKFIPLYIKNKDGPGYHRITSEEIQALKNDPSGDYYTGEGLKNILNKYKLPEKLPDLKLIKAIHPDFVPDNKNAQYKLQSLRGGSILGLPHFGPRPVIYKEGNSGGVVEYDEQKLLLEKNLNGCGGTFINTNFKPRTPNIPFSIGW